MPFIPGAAGGPQAQYVILDDEDTGLVPLATDDLTIEVGGLEAFRAVNDGGTLKLSFRGDAPVTQYGYVNAPSGGVTQDAQARTAITTIANILRGYGLTT